MKRNEKERSLIYIAMGTVINDRPDFYHKCIEALGGMDADVIISHGKYMDPKKLGELPDNVQAFPYVDQLEVLSRADVFINHCGMNSVSESLYMATPMVLYPQTSEQRAVSRRSQEIGAGIVLKDDSAQGIKQAVTAILNEKAYASSAIECSDDFRSCEGVKGAADFIESAPHTGSGVDILKEVNKTNIWFNIIYWLIFSVIFVLFGIFVTWKFVWVLGIFAGVISYPLSTMFQKMRYKALVEKYRKNG